MKIKKNKDMVFIFQITESHLKVIKCQSNSQREIVGLEVEAIPPDIDDKKITAKLAEISKRLGYSHNPVIICLPRNKVTSRYLKVPAHTQPEIEKMVSLQAPRYLPYPPEELITGYQIISTDKEGYSDVNLIIAHKDIIERYVRICKELEPRSLRIILSSYGLGNFYDYINPEASSEVAMIIDADYQQAELAIFSHKKLLFSRYFKIDISGPNWKVLFINEINKTRDAYLKEVSKEAPTKIIVTGARKTQQDFINALNKQIDLPVKALSYDKINAPGHVLNRILNSEDSLTSIIGLGLKEVEESLNFLSQDAKEKNRILAKRKEQLRLILFILGAILIFAVGIAKNLDNKTRYLKQLKTELNKIAQDVRPLEEIEKRLQFIKQRSEKKLSSLDLLYELRRSMPDSLSLVNLNYEEDKQFILRGQAPELNSIFTFVAELKKSPAFKKFNIKVRYATKKKIRTGETVDFEIACFKK